MKPNVIVFHYILKTSTGELIESSRDGEPVSVVQNTGQLVPGLERQMDNMKAGETKSIQVSAEEGYGLMDPKKIMNVPKDKLPKGVPVFEGQQFATQNQAGGVEYYTVTEVDGNNVTLNGNHALAGLDLSFEIEVKEIRPATDEEIQHGHVHGHGCNHH